jgi:hypothetical protein
MSDEELAMHYATHEYVAARAIFEKLGIDISQLQYDMEGAAKDLLKQLQQPAEGV